jgi:hypothetical protein
MSAPAAHRRSGWRLAVPAIMLTGGTALTVGAAAGGAQAAGVASLAVLTVVFTALFWWLGRGESDLAALLASRPDERQRSIDLLATAIAGMVVVLFCLGAAVVNLARGGNG